MSYFKVLFITYVYFKFLHLSFQYGNNHFTLLYRVLSVTRGDINKTTLMAPNSIERGICTAQAIISSTASLASFFWTSFIALNVYLTVVKQNSSLVTRFRALPHIISWGLPLIVLAVTQSYERYGLNVCTGEMLWWCWIANESPHDHLPIVFWQLFSGKLWEMMTYIFTSVMYALVVIDISSYVRIYMRTLTVSIHCHTAYIVAYHHLALTLHNISLS